jgi:hypothetical protein
MSAATFAVLFETEALALAWIDLPYPMQMNDFAIMLEGNDLS